MAMLPNPLPRLADDPTGATLGLRLPPGTLVDATADGAWHEPLLWYADGPADAGTWAALRAARAVGLHPVLIEVDEKSPEGPADWELMPASMSYPGDHDAEEVLAGFLVDLTDDDDGADEDDEREDDGADAAAEGPGAPEDADGEEWAGLAPGGVCDTDPDELAAEATAELVGSGDLSSPHAALVHARRSADIPAAIGWSGPVNHEQDVARLCAVLRSWEDRFGIRLVALGFDTLTVTVAAPPRTLAAAEAVAVEHYAFCPDTIDQGTRPLSEYAQALVDARTWHFWWD
ncbi:DUF4253 domain-containing protein [Streptomyces sp. NBC_01190]|uniref:DUF4253 domain-containing protein n=1 Tax=Streptomyces sp. NBC_01190 TaxID=2903767 RepID=UPI0038682029|nr:DUF4253 domain-containing protein [Streptomyces sp. NBC_01190]